MNSRECLQKTLNREPVNRICVDFGATHVTGISASTLSKVRKALLGEDDYRVKVIEPFQMLGEIDDKLMEALGVDVVPVLVSKSLFYEILERIKCLRPIRIGCG